MSTTMLPLGSYSDSYHHGYCDCMANMAITNVHAIIVHRELSFYVGVASWHVIHVVVFNALV